MLLRTILDVDQETRRTLPKDALEAILRHLRPPDKGTIIGLKQVQIRPPIFRATVTTPVKKSYVQYIRNTIRTYSSYQGVPILVRTKKVHKRQRRNVS